MEEKMMLTLKNISKKFGDRVIYDNFNMSIADGETVGIVGPSGAGKTTLLRIMTGLEPADQGEILLADKIIDPYRNRRDAGKIGVVFQDFQLFPHLNVLANVMIGPLNALAEDKQTTQKSATALLTQLGLADHLQDYPYQLSGGQKQRVAIARALILQPAVLAYDEPTSALDPAMTKDVAALINQFAEQGMTQVVVTHDMPFIDLLAPRVIQVGEENTDEIV
ncbi:glutamine ABC transporter, ATP-binding protein [Schleiferilactobacillus perolens DSM 12744]|uniref:Glutamine ABC transporter, ATP-binding protein n=2 Tax=Schleiferilactobacillus perolens TaxID=100468 RepID=A0A0R1N1X9_9LACO|nr:glutamine ABC transporter, ATP-binding protein [Schleiferilactobacillus perolens DSM 12744]